MRCQEEVIGWGFGQSTLKRGCVYFCLPTPSCLQHRWIGHLETMGAAVGKDGRKLDPCWPCGAFTPTLVCPPPESVRGKIKPLIHLSRSWGQGASATLSEMLRDKRIFFCFPTFYYLHSLYNFKNMGPRARIQTRISVVTQSNPRQTGVCCPTCDDSLQGMTWACACSRPLCIVLAENDWESCPSLVQVTFLRECPNYRLLGLPPGTQPAGCSWRCKRGAASGLFLRGQTWCGLNPALQESFPPNTALKPRGIPRPQGDLDGAHNCPHSLPGTRSLTHTSVWVEASSMQFLLDSRNWSHSCHWKSCFSTDEQTILPIKSGQSAIKP